LTQALLFQPRHESALSEFLLERSLANPFVIGHELFWLLKSQLHVRGFYERFAVILEQLLMLMPDNRDLFIQQININDQLICLIDDVKTKNKKDQLAHFQKKLKSVNQNKTFGNKFIFPLDSRIVVSNFKPEQSKILDSAKAPLWLTFELDSSSQESGRVIFKKDDDLRQDILTIQLLKIMDKIWMDKGYDFKMKTYKVIMTKD
jgi:phosphatidylinositol-4,5-bisphosphate 3-kinase catalytic subunit alpha/beta/delta